MVSRDIMNVLLFVVVVVGTCKGHGRLYEPPSRASAWRFGFNTPKDYNDNEGFCGGFSHQYQTQGGKCGICGDPWEQSPRAHEVGGPYATGLIVRQYLEGDVLNVSVDITANHLGHFELRLCPDPDIEATQDCLDSHRLSLADGSRGDYNISTEIGIYNMQFQLPQQLVCKHCVLQWRYVSGNNWGVCPDGKGALGCGPQEEFRACADISILPRTNLRNLQIPVDLQHLEFNQDPKGLPSRFLNCRGKGGWGNLLGASRWCTLNCNSIPAFCLIQNVYVHGENGSPLRKLSIPQVPERYLPHNSIMYRKIK